LAGRDWAQYWSVKGQSSRYAVPGPHGMAMAAALASLARSPLDGYVQLAARYGDTIKLPYSPGHDFYLLSRPEHAEHVLAANQDNYVKAFTYRPLRALIGDGLLTSEGDRWRQHRRLIQPVFSRRQVTAFGPAMTDAARRLTARWDTFAEGTVINVAGQMSAVTLDIVGQALFGCDLSGDAEPVSRAIGAGQRVAVLASLVPLPWGPTSTRALKALARRVGHTSEGIEGPVGRIVAGRRAVRRTPADGADGTAEGRPGAAGASAGAAAGGTGAVAVGAAGDLLDVLLGARLPDGSPLTDAEIGDEVATFLLAGHETTANTLSWTMALLSAYPSARQRLETELDSVLGDRDPEASDADKLPWTRAVVAEAMRLYPPAWTIERNALADDEVPGVHVAAGSLVAIPPYLVHRHPDFWADPAGFDPRRFMTDGQAPAVVGATPGPGAVPGPDAVPGPGAVPGAAPGHDAVPGRGPAPGHDAASGHDTAPGHDAVLGPGNGHLAGQPRHRYAYIPFGGGRRACVGASFAELETVLVLATIAQRYRLELTVRGIPAPTANVTLRPGRGLPMRLLRRRS
jgi:cytochrome P450